MAVHVVELLPEEIAEALLREADRLLTRGRRLCLVSLTEGQTRASKVLCTKWSSVWQRASALVGGCRPVNQQCQGDPGHRWSGIIGGDGREARPGRHGSTAAVRDVLPQPQHTLVGMTVTGLRFEVTWSFPYPVTTTGTGTGLTMCLRNNDPYLAFLTQTAFEDDVVYVHDFDGSEDYRHPSPPGYDTITGLDYDPIRRWIWACQTTSGQDVVLAVDPTDGSLQRSLTAVLSPTATSPQGLACNGLYILRGGGAAIEAWSLGGKLLGTRQYSGRGISGLSTSPFSFCFVDAYTDEIVVIGPLGNEIAVGSGVGPSGGMEAIAFDTVQYRFMDDIPQLWLENGTIGDPGTPYHPDTPWSPEPWSGRHRIYVANGIDQTVYAGYLTAA